MTAVPPDEVENVHVSHHLVDGTGVLEGTRYCDLCGYVYGVDKRPVGPARWKLNEPCTGKYPGGVEPYVAPTYVGVPRALIVDIDGTLALRNGRSPYDESRVGEDSINWVVAYTVAALSKQYGWHVIITTGRSEKCRPATEKWLEDLPFNPLLVLMRPAGDNRPDWQIKLELFDRHIRPVFDVKLVLDDRQQVVDLWREALGLATFQVAKGNF